MLWARAVSFCGVLYNKLVLCGFLAPYCYRYTKNCLWNRGAHFLHNKDGDFEDLLHKVMAQALEITDKKFQTECLQTVSKWVLSKQDDIINNVKSPFRNKLKQCE
jgi:uncharacterized Fe-S cluster-containing radical SAM superfamily protein